MKICPKCGIKKPLENFYKHKNKKQGVSHSCKLCHNKESKKWIIKNKEKWKEYIKNYSKKTNIV